MKSAIMLLLLVSSASADVKSYECISEKGVKFSFSVNTGLNQPADRWEAEADDGVNPSNCYFFRFTAGDKIVFDCENYQMVRYGFLTIPKSLPVELKANFLFIRQEDGKTSGRFDGKCDLK